jgi:hypothetical protein
MIFTLILGLYSAFIITKSKSSRRQKALEYLVLLLLVCAFIFDDWYKMHSKLP